MSDGMGSTNYFEDFFERLKYEMDKIIPVNIMTIGKTGVGKSTLINSVFRSHLAETGIGKPVTKHLRKITKEGIPLAIYDTKGLELDQSTQRAIKDEIMDEIRRRALDRDEKNYIHAVWYCINSNSNRLEDFEIGWINEMSAIAPVILVLTQSFGKNAKEFAAKVEAMNLSVAGVRPVLAADYEVDENITIRASGLRELVDLTYQALPEAVRKAFVNAQKIDIDAKVAAAKKWALTYISGAFGVGFTPIPFSDAFVLAPAQLAMLAHITAIFGIPVDKALLSAIIGSVGGVGGAVGLGRWIATNLIKFIPGGGTLVGGLMSGATASLVTTGLAFSYIQVMRFVCENEYKGRKTSSAEIAQMMKDQMEIFLRRQRRASDS